MYILHFPVSIFWPAIIYFLIWDRLASIMLLYHQFQQNKEFYHQTVTTKQIEDYIAEKAGLKENDIILELAGTKIENLYDYVYCLQAMKPGTEVDLKINRQGKNMDLKILPTLKE